MWVLASRSDDVGLAVSAADSVEVEHIRLGPLADSAIADIARDRLGPNLDARVEQMLDAAGGNAFLAVQIIDGWRSTTKPVAWMAFPRSLDPPCVSG